MKKIVVLGAGISGMGAAQLAVKKGYDVFLSDAGVIKDSDKKILKDLAIDFEEGSHDIERILKADIIVKSPGIPQKSEVIQLAREKKIGVISEIEFASRFTKAKLIAITGSNGKTTTTSLVYHLLTNAGFDVGLAGNIGESFAYKVATEIHDYYVLEVSSFQLDDIQSFKPYIAILLNITPDHLDQYDGKLELYAKSKFRITSNQKEEDYFVYNYDDKYVVELLKDINTGVQKVSYSTKVDSSADVKVLDKKVYLKDEPLIDFDYDKMSIRGEHNFSNSLAATIAANFLKIDNKKIREGLMSFSAIEHRMEKFLDKDGISFYNDSKATNVNSVYYALESMKGKTVWIVGGVDKGNDYSELYELVKSKVEVIVCLGLDNQKIVKAFEATDKIIIETSSMQAAVSAAWSHAKGVKNILLSPACASFDLFKNFEDRGTQFKNAVNKIR